MNRKTQRARILRPLIDARGDWVPLPEILALGIAQYNARIFELRRMGFAIENRTETDPETGERHSWFRLANNAAANAATTAAEKDWFAQATGKPRPTEPTHGPGPLFGEGVA